MNQGQHGDVIDVGVVVAKAASAAAAAAAVVHEDKSRAPR